MGGAISPLNNYNPRFPKTRNYSFDYAILSQNNSLEAATYKFGVRLERVCRNKSKSKDSEGNAVSGVPVAFELNNSEGGSSVSSANSVSDGNGESVDIYKRRGRQIRR